MHCSLTPGPVSCIFRGMQVAELQQKLSLAAAAGAGAAAVAAGASAAGANGQLQRELEERKRAAEERAAQLEAVGRCERAGGRGLSVCKGERGAACSRAAARGR